MIQKFKSTILFTKIFNAKTRIIVNVGGARSSKTHTIAENVIVDILRSKNQNKIYTICRKSMPSLKTSVMRDFFNILIKMGLYNDKNRNRNENTYKMNGNLIEFVSIDQPQKKRGAERHVLWMNEANEFTVEDFRQLTIRTKEKIYLDYNPSDYEHWIDDIVLTRDDVTLIRSTYKDNPFLNKSLVQEIERLKDTDEYYWQVYGLGQRAIPNSVIYPNWVKCQKLPEKNEIIYGMDFGFNNPTTIIKIEIDRENQQIYLQQVLYETKLTNTDLINRMNEIIDKTDQPYIYADSAEPNRIEEIYRAGFNIHRAKKNVMDGIDFIKRFKLFIHHYSTDLISEIKYYKYKSDKNGKILETPVKYRDHCMDAMRYGIFSHSKNIEQPILQMPKIEQINTTSITRQFLKGFY